MSALEIVDHGARSDRSDVAALVELFASRGVRPYPELGVIEARRSMEGVTRSQAEAPHVDLVHDILVPVSAGSVPARVYHPRPGTPLPLVVYVHGGGWMLGGVRPADRPCRRLAVEAGAVVVSLEYRLAPENPFPAGYEDVVAGIAWIAANAEGLGASERLTVVGDSAGGNLVAASALRFREPGGPGIDELVLVYPCLAPERESLFPSYTENAEAPVVDRATMRWFWDAYVDSAAHRDDERVFPLLAASLEGFPSTTVVVSEHDVLRDEGIAFAERLAAAGVPVSCHRFVGGIHGFWWLDAALEQAAELTTLIASRVAR